MKEQTIDTIIDRAGITLSRSLQIDLQALPYRYDRREWINEVTKRALGSVPSDPLETILGKSRWFPEITIHEIDYPGITLDNGITLDE